MSRKKTLSQAATVEMMSPSDQDRWRSAGNMWQLGQMTAAWLNGDIASHPGLRPGVGPPPDITGTPVVRYTLAELNRSALVTLAAQRGGSGTGVNGDRWLELPAVWGVATNPVLNNLVARIHGHGLTLHTHQARPVWKLFGRGVAVAFYNSKPITVFGSQLSARQLRDRFSTCTPEIHDLLARCTQFTICQPEGADDLWQVLNDFAGYQRYER